MLLQILNRIKNDKGFMGLTHSLSAVASWLLIAALLPSFMFDILLGTKDYIVFIASIFVVAGAALLPDLDNTKSTALSTLGIVGQGLSSLMRGSAVFIYRVFHSKYDDPTPNPHRGFWHTLASSVVWLLLVKFTVSIQSMVTIPIIEKQAPIGFLFAVLWIFICLRLAFASLFSKYIKRMKKDGFATRITFLMFSVVLSTSVLLFSPASLDYSWIAYAVCLGYIFHILGDTMTIAGTPLLWPLKHKGKMWWTCRIIGIRAGGTVEKRVFIPLFIVIILFSIGKIILF